MTTYVGSEIGQCEQCGCILNASDNGGYPPRCSIKHCPQHDQDVWRWKNCRSLAVSIDFFVFPWEWFILAGKFPADVACYQSSWFLQLGPFGFKLSAGIGYVSNESRWRAFFGLSEHEAWERANGRKP